jgi:heme-degrading monooxygenase HmoA
VGTVAGAHPDAAPFAASPIGMFVCIAHLAVPTDDHAQPERHLHQRSRLVDGFRGFLDLQLLRLPAGQAAHAFLTAWASREAFGRNMRSDEHARSHSREPAEIMTRSSVGHACSTASSVRSTSAPR